MDFPFVLIPKTVNSAAPSGAGVQPYECPTDSPVLSAKPEESIKLKYVSEVACLSSVW